MKFNPDDIKKAASEDFDAAWNKGTEYISESKLNDQYPHMTIKFGKPHPVYDTISKLRDAYLRMGFEEMMNPLIVDEREVHKQFSHEALAVLDRCFYLAGLPRPNVGISDERIAEIKEILGGVDDEAIETIRKVLHAYKKGDVEGDDLVPEIAASINVSDSLVVEMIDQVFPEFKELIPQATKKTLRSHMTSGWFISLSSIIERANPPFNFFSIDRCFRREQDEDAARLMTYYSASCVIMDENVTIDHGKAVAQGLLSQFGFEKFMFRPDDKRSKYYVPDTQIEVFAYHPNLVGSKTKYSDGWIEIATFGIYSPIALSQYNIPYPVMNLGLGVERLAMILHDATDIRSLTYPQITQYSEWKMTDNELAKNVKVANVPETAEGMDIVKAIVDICKEHGSTPSPCEFPAWEGEIDGKKVKVSVIEPEEETKLCGPAVFNEVVAYENDILGVPDNKKWKKVLENHSARTGITFLDAFACQAVKDIESAVANGESEVETRVRIVKVPSEINIRLEPLAQRFITSNKKKIDIRGPVFTTVRATIE
ncbi:phosphoserine-tRNA(Cys) ligase [Methanolobus vulcani]|jgi:O-phosphoseryl-tRNA synthetase|uniref:O-phosphoserine--tRNA(Cys) ligase n=1 Tax=Methanolobus vulcani TaxID=38026 RepID=A0A7Z7FE49_9EURY|nr:O-phosphoserine--tRNA ligase [Methanolobus vulcani]MDK2825923.1 O-phosphoseryl-tRNA synthetase [Methanolobus sp.]SDF74398.1 phosphoserine-tRNA(Cys) ligase [Methanolobus vulcani]